VSRHAPTLVKFGGELVESPERLATVGEALSGLAAAGPLVVVHGGGREIDAELARRGVAKRAVDGLRITDAPTLEAVVATLAGTINTRLVAHLVTRGLKAVGLTGVDAALARAGRADAHVTAAGARVDLGLVGEPVPTADLTLVQHLLDGGFVPVIASLGISADGDVLNVNADTLAAHVAAGVGARQLLLAGGTAGVLDGGGQTIAELTPAQADALMQDGTASAGMIAKLRAATTARARGVAEVCIVDGRSVAALAGRHGTRIA
jgi:acetylglutamate kinase